MGTLPGAGGINPGPVPTEGAPPLPEVTTPSPSTPGPATRGPAGPTTPGPAQPANAVGGPFTGARGVLLGPDPSRWQDRWEHNREPYLRARVPELDAPVTGTDGFFMGGSAKRATRLLRRKHVGRLALPELIELLESNRSQPTAIACLHAIARIGRDHRGRDVTDVLRVYLAHEARVVRENAVLALGISQREKAAEYLIPILRDNAEGRQAVRRDQVDERTRAFAAYGLGLIARASPRVDFKLRIGKQLEAVLAEPKKGAGDVVVAAVNGLRALHGGTEARGGERRVVWLAVKALMGYYHRDVGKAEQALQAHVPPSVAALLGRGDTPEHRQCKEAFFAELKRTDRSPEMAQSAAIALGVMAAPAEVTPGDEPYSHELLRYARKGVDQQARYFAWMALGQIGGVENRSRLLRAFSRANNLERPWVGLALGVLAHAARSGSEDQQPPDATIGHVLLGALRDNKNDEVRSALALALGLTGHLGAVPELRKLLARYGKREQLSGYLSLALSLLDDRRAGERIRGILDEHDHQPELVRRTGVALALLGDTAGNERVADVLSKTNNAGSLRGASEALGYQRGVSCGPSLLALLDNRRLGSLALANVAAALGRSADKDWMPWFVTFAVNSNYRAAVPTLTDHAMGVLDRR